MILTTEIVIFVGLLKKYRQKWEKEKEEKDWTRWEECEIMREEMGHTTNIVKIPRFARPPRKKHGH